MLSVTLIFEGVSIRLQKSRTFQSKKLMLPVVQIREDLKTNPEYLNDLIFVLGNSIKNLSEENKRLKDSIGQNDQVNLIELQDKVEMLNRRFFNKGKESLNKSRPPKDNQKELLPHNVPPINISSNQQENVPEVDIVHTEATCPCCGNTDLVEMTDQFEESSEHDLQAKSVIRKKHKKQKYRCKSCDKIVTAKGGAKVRPKSKYSIGFSVGVAFDKYSYHLPLERISRQFQEQGLRIDTKTLFSQTEAVHLNLAPILDKMKEEIISYGYVHVDETRGKILSNSTNGFIWSMCNKYGAYFQFETTRSGAVAEEMLGKLHWNYY